MKRTIKFLLARPVVSALPLTIATLLAGAVALIMADFGEPLWMFLPLFLWLLTIGLPVTLGVLTVAALWGMHPLLTGFLPFAICAAAAGLACEWLFLCVCSKIVRGRSS